MPAEPNSLQITLVQPNPNVGAIAANTAHILDSWRRAADAGSDLVITPELSLTGYPPRDLLHRPELLDGCARAIDTLLDATRTGPALIVGAPRPRTGRGKPLHNSALLLDGGDLVAERAKSLLPDYDVFDESRWFAPANENSPIAWRGLRLGLTVCEDLWNDEGFWKSPLYDCDPARDLVAAGIDLLINISASPWSRRKIQLRQRMLARRARESGVPLLYVNQTGANDDLIFDGGSMAFDTQGEVIDIAPFFEPAERTLLWARREGTSLATQTPPSPVPDDTEALYRALVLGLRDYVHKSGFERVVLGLSGGIDSALCATLAADALGPANVMGLAMPGPFSSEGSVRDALALADNLGIRCETLPIDAGYRALDATLAPVFGDAPFGLAHENLQSRLRGVLVMALSNQTGALVLTTGNKSELAVGYCTLYGDMCGALAVLADVPKTEVWRLARWINRSEERIPVASIEKPPSAELRPDQKDEDSLPPYPVLDAIIEGYVERGQSAAALVASGLPAEAVDQVIGLLRRNEFKRRQAAPALKVTRRAFGLGWRMPVVAVVDAPEPPC